MSRLAYQLTPEQLAKREERKLKKLAEGNPKAAQHEYSLLALANHEMGRVLTRPWVTVGALRQSSVQNVTVKTWNLLAQTLVRRSLFPKSDCLKASQREHMLYRELLGPRADILCLQEVDRLEKILPFLHEAGYDHIYASGPRKKHGCLIAFDRLKYRPVGEKVVFYDEECIRESDNEHTRRGCTHRTKNIALVVALANKNQTGGGLVVGTTHLFWHPAYTYERTRQSGILLREVVKFRSDHSENWPCILAGDFNFAPDDPAYALLVGAPLLSTHGGMLARSRVVHVSLDPTVPVTTKKMIGVAPSTADDEGEATHVSASPGVAEDDEDGATDPDRAITNARPAIPSDGLLSTQELAALFKVAGAPVRSVIDLAQRLRHAPSTCGPRLQLSPERPGAFEPEWTSYTHYWKTVLDYIFVLDPPDATVEVVGYLQPPTTQELEPGIPMKCVCSSDHISICSAIRWVPCAA